MLSIDRRGRDSNAAGRPGRQMRFGTSVTSYLDKTYAPTQAPGARGKAAGRLSGGRNVTIDTLRRGG